LVVWVLGKRVEGYWGRDTLSISFESANSRLVTVVIADAVPAFISLFPDVLQYRREWDFGFCLNVLFVIRNHDVYLYLLGRRSLFLSRLFFLRFWYFLSLFLLFRPCWLSWLTIILWFHVVSHGKTIALVLLLDKDVDLIIFI